MPEKQRLDQLLVEKGLAKSRSFAQRLILAGEVFVDGEMRDKPAQKIFSASTIKLKEGRKFVSQGGLKLERALQAFNLDVRDLDCVDIGASTGGFTDCLLKNAARKVYSIDVGKGQLDWKLRNDSRVVVIEGMNARYLQPEQISDPIDLIVIDVSFISLKLIIPPAIKCLKLGGSLIALVKPQFEAGPERVQRGGVVKDPAVHIALMREIAYFCMDEQGLSLANATYSPVKGPAGNIEFLLHLKLSNDPSKLIDWAEFVDEAHADLSQ
jgi:23S rRNA (cytidine1920-2'-O)/16S rRNA (cytidine1409-2'-O)-methyltransferase